MQTIRDHPAIRRMMEYGEEIPPVFCEFCGQYIDDVEDCEVGGPLGGYICPECMNEFMEEHYGEPDLL